MSLLSVLFGNERTFGKNARMTHHFTPTEMMQAIATSYAGSGKITCTDVTEDGVMIQHNDESSPRLFQWAHIMNCVQDKFKCLKEDHKYDLWLDNEGLHIAELRG